MDSLQMIQELMVRAAILTPVVAGIVQVVKQAGVPGRFVPLLSLAVGTGLGLVVLGATVAGGVVGAIIGLAATGLYEFGKTTVGGN